MYVLNYETVRIVAVDSIISKIECLLATRGLVIINTGCSEHSFTLIRDNESYENQLEIREFELGR